MIIDKRLTRYVANNYIKLKIFHIRFKSINTLLRN